MRWLQRGGVVGVAVCLLSALGNAPALRAADPGQGPRPISDAERRAVELVALYLDRGPEAWLPELAAGSPLRAMTPEAALAEIGARAGPPGEAHWHLETPTPGTPDGTAVFGLEFPSGVEDVLTVRLVQGPDGWRIVSLRCLADPVQPEDAFWQEVSRTGRSAPSAGTATTPGRDALRSVPGVPATAAALAVLLALMAAAAYGGRRKVRAAGLVAGAGLAVLLALACGRGGDDRNPKDRSTSDRAGSAAVKGLVRLGRLRDLRWAIAAGRDRESVDRLYQQVETGGGPELVTQIATLWRAETLMSQVDLHEAEAALATVPSPAPVPLGEVLRARLAYVRSDLDTTGQRYQKAETSGADSESLSLEAVQALTTLGLYDQAEVEVTQLAEMGSRQADVYYSMARYSAVADKDGEAEDYLRRAWRLAPVMREDLFGDPLISHLCARPTLFPLFEFDRPEEPIVEPERLASRPAELPAGARARLSDQDLEIDVGDGRLEVAAGAELAPPDVTRESALDRRRRDEEGILSRLPSLIEAARSPEILAQPRRRQEVVDASIALSRHDRWDELVELTEGVSQVLDRVPSSVVQLRAAALDHTGRTAEAQTLLVALAKHLVAGKRRDPGTFYQLAELFASSGHYDLAVRLIRRAAELAPL
jgi:tetratricopeptide (TPR) repeat protein